MAVHESFVALMSRLVEKNGRPVSVRRNIGTSAVEVGKPWLGVTPVNEDTAHTACFLDHDLRSLLILLPDVADERTDIAREIDRLVLLPARLADGTDLPYELDISHKLVDGATVWNITRVVKIQPGPRLIGYVVRIAA